MANKTDYDPKLVKVAKQMCALGATDAELADAFGIHISTFHRWKHKHKDLAEALEVGKEVADKRVERSLYSRANGYEHDETDIRVVAGQLVQTPIRKYYPPDTVACIFWLKNRRPDEWRDKQDHAHTGNVTITATPSDNDL